MKKTTVVAGSSSAEHDPGCRLGRIPGPQSGRRRLGATS